IQVVHLTMPYSTAYFAPCRARWLHSINRHSWKPDMSKEASTLTISVPEAGKRYFGLSRNGSYDAATRGEIPVIRIGRLMRVPIRLMERMLDQAGDQPASS